VGETRVLASAPPAATPDAAKAAAEIKAAPLSQAQQIEVIGLVKELGAQLRDTRTQVTELHEAVAQLSKQIETRTDDFEVRLSGIPSFLDDAEHLDDDRLCCQRLSEFFDEGL
jgi:ABC-type transporter Mla subunit MlaD